MPADRIEPGTQRDLVGYGRNPPSVGWPGGARVALSFVLNYEEGSERSFAFGDGRNEGLGEVTRPVEPNVRDLATESVYEYGSRAGVHRLLRIFHEYDAPCTFFAAAVALEKNPSVCDWIREDGHEPCSHGWRWSEDWMLPPDIEAERIRLAVASIEASCGERPVGWYNRWMPSVNTRRLLVEEGGFLYDSNSYADDLPYYVRVGARSHLVVPYTLTYNDSRFVNGSYASPTDFFDYCKRALDVLWDEGADVPRMMSIGLHPRFSGQAGRASAVRDILAYAREKGDVWITTRRSIAEWWLEEAPPSA